jgi:hypothetical protein
VNKRRTSITKAEEKAAQKDAEKEAGAEKKKAQEAAKAKNAEIRSLDARLTKAIEQNDQAEQRARDLEDELMRSDVYVLRRENDLLKQKLSVKEDVLKSVRSSADRKRCYADRNLRILRRLEQSGARKARLQAQAIGKAKEANRHAHVAWEHVAKAETEAGRAVEAKKLAESCRRHAETGKQDAERTAQWAVKSAHRQAGASDPANRRWDALAEGLRTDKELRSFFSRRQDSRGAKGSLQVVSAWKVVNAVQLQAFRSAWSFDISACRSHRQGDSFLFHGCPENSAPNIQAEGLKMHYASAGMLGRGLYGAPDPRKSETYCSSTGGSVSTNGKFMFVCRFNLSGAKQAGPSTSHQNRIFSEYCVYDDRHVVVLWMLKLW